MSISFEIRGYPMPPVEDLNQTKSRQYYSEVARWSIKNAHQLQTARIIIENMFEADVLFVERVFYHKSWRIVGKHGQPIKNRTHRRIDLLDDTLGKLLYVDTSIFWDGSYKKRFSPHISLGEFVDLKFTEIPLPENKENQLDT